MKKRVSVLLGAILLCLLLMPLTVTTAWADYDEIVSYDITVQPNAEDGSLLFKAEFTWKALESLPYGQELKIGIPNGSIREETALTDNIERLAFDNSYMYVYLDREYDDGETFQFAYSWVQEYMYTLDGSGGVNYDYTPGWFDEARIDSMSVTWQDPQGVDGTLNYEVSDPSRWTFSGATVTGTNLPHGAKVRLTVDYPHWPAELDPEMSRDNQPDDDWGGGGGGGYDYDSGMDFADMVRTVLVIIFVVVIIVTIVKALGGSYSGGFGTHYVFYHNLWYPAGPDGKPKPGSVGTVHKPKPPASSHSSSGGLGGGHRGGGFGGGGFGGGSHCACASSCACACACACAGGGRAGCSAKNLYGAIRLDEEMSRRLERRADE